VPAGKGPETQGLWTRQEATDVHSFAAPGGNVLWGCDMEEEQAHFLIRELAALNPEDPSLKWMVSITNDGYSRKMAPELLDLAIESKENRDELQNDLSFRQNLLATLQIDKNRLNVDTKMDAQNERELLMKNQFLAHFHHSSVPVTQSKIFLRFGSNHLHRGSA
jgi:hypothetical protein